MKYFMLILSVQVAVNSLQMQIHSTFKKSVRLMNMNLAERIRESTLRKFQPDQVQRVIGCWNDFIAGKKLHRYLDDDKKVLQTADCFVTGLTGQSFHDVTNFSWINGLEDNYQMVLQELVAYEAKRRNMKLESSNDLLQVIKPTGEGEQGDGEWLGPRDTSGSHYGPEWKTLGLQDRSVWSEELIHEFPSTIQLLKDLKVPSCEVFFAKQGPKSGLKPHSDKNNFIMTCHLALDVPEGECWIKVGDSTYYWKNGKTCIFDTSVIHSTENLSDRTRYVLLIRFWHPELTPIEIEAFKFIFACLDYASMGDDALDQFEMRSFMGQDNHQGLTLSAEDVTARSMNRSLQNISPNSGNVVKTKQILKEEEEFMSGNKNKKSKSVSSSGGFGKKKGFGSK